jgi:hypothetical protein
MHSLQRSNARQGVVYLGVSCHLTGREETLGSNQRFPMTQTTTFTAPGRTLGQLVAAPFVAIGNFLIALAEAGPRMKQIEKLNALSDADLAALGKTRDGEVRRIFGARLYI